MDNNTCHSWGRRHLVRVSSAPLDWMIMPKQHYCLLGLQLGAIFKSDEYNQDKTMESPI